ncbi:MAG: tRNA pseudouridine(38-40) synthase TruA [Firmicutes bacterium]|nr:tRNA pseudouridine(38-40) synthase TruA [Bacillota bacterium]
MKNILLKIAYDGTGFSGWQRQPGSRTVCGEIERVLSSLTGEDIKLDGTSRTDAGVHALGQCASFRSDMKIPVENLAKAMNDAFAKDRLEGIGEIRILEAREMPEDFHARYSSKGKRYIYRISCGKDPDVFCRNYCYQIKKDLDADAMREAAGYIVGEHDFACFQSAGSPKESTVRTVYSLSVEKDGGNVLISVSGNGFLYNMVRIITGTLVEVGLGKRTPESVKDAIDSCDRQKAGHTAPPQGLYLDEVFFD